LLQADDGALCSVPPQWTDAVTPDPEIVMGQGRALLRVADLLELADLVSRLCQGRPCEALAECKDNSAAYVRQLMPQNPQMKI
jgi:Family of unknown function (DUF5372)